MTGISLSHTHTQGKPHVKTRIMLPHAKKKPETRREARHRAFLHRKPTLLIWDL